MQENLPKKFIDSNLCIFSLAIAPLAKEKNLLGKTHESPLILRFKIIKFTRDENSLCNYYS